MVLYDPKWIEHVNPYYRGLIGVAEMNLRKCLMFLSLSINNNRETGVKLVLVPSRDRCNIGRF